MNSGQFVEVHGESSCGRRPTPEYEAWCSMHKRCRPRNHRAAKYYVGISVCARWASYANFLADVGRRPSAKHSLDRWPNGDGNYEPGNVRWATVTEQNHNRRGLTWLTIGDERRPATEWAHHVGINPQTLFERLKRGWTPEAAVSTPVRVQRSSHG